MGRRKQLAEWEMQYCESRDLAEHKDEVDKMLGMLAVANESLAPTAWVLDVGGGAGMHSAMIASRVQKVICTDFSDQNARFGGEFVKLLHEKFARNGYDFPLVNFEFHTGDATNLIYKDSMFDLVVSFNAMEHIPDPGLAFSEMFRVVRPGGLIYLTFDPIWTCDSGSHFYHRVPRPWQHLLHSDDEYVDAIISAGGNAEEVDDFRHAMNRRRLSYYREMFDRWRDRAEFVLEYREHENFARCIAANYSEEELMFRGMAKVIRKLPAD
jgi:SAM-dependent methyltransferase